VSPFLRKLAELKEPRGWVHHVADAATGKLLTTQLDRTVSRRGIVDSAGVLERGKGTGWIAWKPGRSRSRPVTPLSRAERLSQLGRQFHPFSPPTHRLTPKQPYQASPEGFIGFQWTSDVTSYYGPDGEAIWLLSDIVPPMIGRMDALLRDAPQGRCLLTLLLGITNQFDQGGHIRIEVRGQPAENAPLIASFDLTTQGNDYIEHTFDLVYVSETTPPTCWPAMILHVLHPNPVPHRPVKRPGQAETAGAPVVRFWCWLRASCRQRASFSSWAGPRQGSVSPNGFFPR
jgi:hypothetical protein